MKNWNLAGVTALIMILLAGCAAGGAGDDAPVADGTLLVSGPAVGVSYTVADLEAMPAQEALFSTEFSDPVTYVGVSLPSLLEAAGIDLTTVKIVKVVASDGYTRNFDAANILLPEATIAYERVDGPMDAEDGTFRLIIPGTEGEFNVKLVVEIQVITG